MAVGLAKAGALALEAVSCRLGGRVVVDEVSFTAPSGRVTAMVGPSGCGKTTLLRLIAGIERPQGGRILIDGSEVSGPSIAVPPEARRVGLMFQDYALFPHLTVLENVLFGLGDLPRPARRSVGEEALARVGLGAFAGRYPARLSGGEQQRLALARALAPAPRILLMDEPFSNLDRGLRDEVRLATLAVLEEAGVTALVVSHDPEEALSVGEHLVLLEGGRVIQAGPAQELYARPANLSAARALSDVNLVSGRFEEGGLRTPFGLVAANGRAGEGGTACFRPEHLLIRPAGPGLAGRIVARSFRGASTLVSVATGDRGEPMRVSVPSGRLPPGEDVIVTADLGAAMVFASGAENTSISDGASLDAFQSKHVASAQTV